MVKVLNSAWFKSFGGVKQRLDDIHSFGLIEEFLPRKSYFPITSSSLGFHSISTVVNDISINRRSTVIEFGSGLSTIVLAAYASKYNPRLRVFSVEHDPLYLSYIRDVLDRENLSDYVVFISCDLCDYKLDDVVYKWYSGDALDAALGDIKLDAVLIDGPISLSADPLVRFPAIDFVIGRLNYSYAIFLDDVHRNGERMILDLANRNYQISFRRISQTLAIAHQGTFYNPIP